MAKQTAGKRGAQEVYHDISGHARWKEDLNDSRLAGGSHRKNQEKRSGFYKEVTLRARRKWCCWLCCFSLSWIFWPLALWSLRTENWCPHCTYELDPLLSALTGLPWWLRGQSICLQGRRPGFDPWVGKIPWRRRWQPHSSMLAWRIPWMEEPGRLQSMGSQRAGNDWATSLLKNTFNSVSLMEFGHLWFSPCSFRILTYAWISHLLIIM